MSTLEEAVDQAKRELGADADSITLMERAKKLLGAQQRALSAVPGPGPVLRLVETYPDEMHAVSARVAELEKVGIGSHFLDVTDAFGRVVIKSGVGQVEERRTALLELAARAMVWARETETTETDASRACPRCSGRGSVEHVPPREELLICRDCAGRGVR